MPKKNAMNKPVHSYRLSDDCDRQLKSLSARMGRSEGEVIEVAIDRMYREEIRFGNLSVADGEKPEDRYKIEEDKE